MKKLSILVLMVFGYFSNAVAIEGINLGVSLTAGVFEADGAKEEFKGAHAGGASPGNVSKSNVPCKDANVWAESACRHGYIWLLHMIMKRTNAAGRDRPREGMRAVTVWNRCLGLRDLTARSSAQSGARCSPGQSARARGVLAATRRAGCGAAVAPSRAREGAPWRCLGEASSREALAPMADAG